MKHTVSSWFKVFHDHETVFHPDSRCFMTMFNPDSTCFTVFHDHETNCFVADSSWFNMFHHCFIALIYPVSCWFNLFHHCFITVSPVGTSLYLRFVHRHHFLVITFVLHLVIHSIIQLLFCLLLQLLNCCTQLLLTKARRFDAQAFRNSAIFNLLVISELVYHYNTTPVNCNKTVTIN